MQTKALSSRQVPSTVIVAAVLLASIPTALLAVLAIDGSVFGFYHDEGFYLAGAKSLAQEGAYRALILPGEPLQAKFPPLFSLFLAPLWLTNTTTREVVKEALILNACLMPLIGIAAYRVFLAVGLNSMPAILLAGILVLNPTLSFLAVIPQAEPLYLLLALSACALASKPAQPRGWKHLGSGLFLSGAFLARTSALTLIASTAWWSVRERNRALNATVATLIFPALASFAWTAWVLHAGRTNPPEPYGFNSNYIAAFLSGANLGDLIQQLLTNSFFLFASYTNLLFGLVAPVTKENQFWHTFVGLLLFGALLRDALAKGWNLLYVHFIFHSILHLAWPYPPVPRFLLPILPALLLALYRTLSQIPWPIKSGNPAWGSAWSILLLAGPTSAYTAIVELPKICAQLRETRRLLHPSLQWINEHAAPGDLIFAYSNALVYWETGHHSRNLPIAPYFVSARDKVGILQQLYRLDIEATKNKADLLLWTEADYPWEILPEDRRKIRQRLSTSPLLQQVHESAFAVMYRIRSTTSSPSRSTPNQTIHSGRDEPASSDSQ